jgi:hypothetical protein
MDTEITFGNTYFYKIRAISTDGTPSSRVARGIKITDETYEKKQRLVVDETERAALSDNFVELSIPILDASSDRAGKMSTFRLLPNFSNPSTPSETTIIPPQDVPSNLGRAVVKPTYSTS